MSIIKHQLCNKSVLVTGATGFIGGRLAERLASEEEANVTGCGRSLEKAAWLEPHGVRLLKLDLENPTSLAQALAGQDVVFHVAAHMSEDDEALSHAINVDATRRLVELAGAAGVQRVVHVSSIAAYGPPQQENLVETVGVDTTQKSVYGRTKALGEQGALAAGREAGVEVSVVRPGMVYGPRSGAWSVLMVKLLQKRTPVIFGRGDGHASPVYIDNLVDMLLLAAVEPAAAGEAFNAVDRPVLWRDYFGYYAAMGGYKVRRRLPLPLVRLVVWFVETARLRLRLSSNMLNFYTVKQVYPIDKARSLLAYAPRIDIDEGMRRTEAWLRSEGII